MFKTTPIHSMYGIYAYIDLQNHPNVDIMAYMERLGYIDPPKIANHISTKNVMDTVPLSMYIRGPHHVWRILEVLSIHPR